MFSPHLNLPQTLSDIDLFLQSRFTRDGIEVLTNARVREVRNDRVLFSQVEDGKTVVKEIPMGFCLWSTGVG